MTVLERVKDWVSFYRAQLVVAIIWGAVFAVELTAEKPEPCAQTAQLEGSNETR